MIKNLQESLQDPSNRKFLLFGLFAFGGVLIVSAISLLSGGIGSRNQDLIWYSVQRGDLPIKVTERGNLESQENIDVLCMVDDVSGDEIHGTPIVWVIPNGSAVKKGELLLELDTASQIERLDRQSLETNRARSANTKAKIQYENRITQNATLYQEGELQVELAKIGLDQYEDAQGGTFQISLQDVELLIQEAQASSLIEETNLEGVKQLYNLGYRSHGELAEARLQSMRSNRQLASAIAKRRELLEYEYKKKKMELEGDLASAKRALRQIARDNEALLEQAQADMEEMNEDFLKESERKERYENFIENCKVYAPQDGLVAYANRGRYSYVEIRPGSNLRYRQKILTLPNLSKMQIKTSIHESVLDQVHAGLTTTIRIDALPNSIYQGLVQSVAVLPDQGNYMSSDTKVYETVITVDDEVTMIKPGMTAVVEIHIDHLENVISVPVQAIVQIKKQTWVYVDREGQVLRQDIEIGRTNEKFVEITQGLSEGDQIVLNPMAIIDEAALSESADRDEGKELSNPTSDE
jgi:HlyD family secretion protein